MFRRQILAVLLLALGLTGCGSAADMRDKLGLNREGPDEYRVVPRPPLSMPPDFALRPPGEGSQYVSGMAAQDRARDQIVGGANAGAAQPGSTLPFLTPAGPNSTATTAAAVAPVTSAPLATSTDAQFLANAGVTKTDPQIRQKLLDDKLNGVGGTKDPSYLFGGKTQDDSQVDATKEADRIKLNKDQNKPVTNGDTPVIQPADKGLLGDIF